MRAIVVAFLASVMVTGSIMDAQTTAPKVSAAARTQLRLAFFAVEDLRPLGDDFAFRDEQAQSEVRRAKAVVDSKVDRLAAERIETFLMERETCRTVATPDDYEACERKADVNHRWLVTVLQLTQRDTR